MFIASAFVYSRVVDANLILVAVPGTLEHAEDIAFGLRQHGGDDDAVEYQECWRPKAFPVGTKLLFG